LATIYAGLIGSDWVSQDNWLREESICTWSGVTCDDQGLLQVLSLPANELVGRVSTVYVLVCSERFKDMRLLTCLLYVATT